MGAASAAAGRLGEVMREALIRSAVDSARQAEEHRACEHDRIILSCKVSDVQDLIAVYRALARTLRLPPAPGPDRGRHGQQGHRRVHRRNGRVAAGRHRRHHSGFADAQARPAADQGSDRSPGDAAEPGPAGLLPDGDGLPGMRTEPPAPSSSTLAEGRAGLRS